MTGDTLFPPGRAAAVGRRVSGTVSISVSAHSNDVGQVLWVRQTDTVAETDAQTLWAGAALKK